MRKSFLLFLFIGISLFISCESQEDIFKTQENVSSVYKTTINNYLTKIKLTAAGNIENAKKINILIESLDYTNVRVYDFQSPKKILVVNLNNSSGSSSAVQTKVLFVILNEEIISSRLVTIDNNSSASFDDMTIISAFKKDTNISGYSGTITFFNLFQRMLLSNQYYNGNLVISKAIEKNPNAMMSKSVLCIEWYLVTTYQDGFQTKEYQYTTCDSCSLDEIFESLCDSDGGTGGSGGIDASQEIEDRIDDSKLDTCLQTILSKLKTLTTGVNQIVVNFAGNTPNYNWNLKSDYLNGPTGGTNPPALYDFSTGSITTTFDSKTWTDATDLSWARTMLHESIHAYLATQFAINKKDFYSSYPTMVSEWGELQNWNAIHHEEIARSIVKDVALALEEYGKSSGYNLTSQFYQDMAWGGLQDTNTFKKLPFTDQQRILNVISIELTGTNTNGNSKQQNGKKAGC